MEKEENTCLNCKEIEIVDLEFQREERILFAFCKYNEVLNNLKPCKHYKP